MSEEAMIKHYEKTPKETLIKILVASRKEVEKLQNRNKELKQEIERLNEDNEYLNKVNIELSTEKNRLNNIINELEEEISKHIALCTDITLNDILDKLHELKGEDKE